MRLVMINRFYWPDRAATAQMLQDLAEDLAAAGHDIRVVASRSWYAEDQAPLPRRDSHQGVAIHRVGGTRFGRGSSVGRILDYLSFLMGAARELAAASDRDIVVMTDPPLSFALALAVAKLRGRRVIHWVQDLYPALAVQLGVLRPTSLVNRLYRRFAPGLHSGCRLTIALGPKMAEVLVAEGAPVQRTVVAHNWADAEAIRPIEPSQNTFATANGLTGKFVVLYSGNAGRGHEFAAVREAMELLRDEPDIRFVFIGGGAQMPALREFVRQRGLPNVQFFDYVDRERLAETLSSASVSLVTEDPRVAGLLVPSKTYGILAAGRPILFLGAADSDVARIVHENDAGRVLDPFDGAALAVDLRNLLRDPERVARLGANGRRAAETKYDRRLATRHWAALVNAALH
jgi:glycosyltransferase involved in cell wall biosynthesis